MQQNVWKQTINRHKILFFFGCFLFALCFLCFPKKVYAATYNISKYLSPDEWRNVECGTEKKDITQWTKFIKNIFTEAIYGW